MTDQPVSPPPDLAALRGLLAQVPPVPWTWRDEYELHKEHQALGLDADCENIAAGRIKLVAGDGRVVLEPWAEYADDVGLTIDLAVARLIAALRNAAPWLLARAEEVERLQLDPLHQANLAYGRVHAELIRERDAAKAEAARLRAAIETIMHTPGITRGRVAEIFDAALAPPPEGEEA